MFESALLGISHLAKCTLFLNVQVIIFRKIKKSFFKIFKLLYLLMWKILRNFRMNFFKELKKKAA